MIVRLSTLKPGTNFTTPLTRRPGVVRSIPENDNLGIWVELEGPDERKTVHMDVCVDIEAVH